MPRQVDHLQRRREFAEAVWAVIAAQGIEGVTLRAVAAEAGVSVGRVQHYYATREELVRDSCRLMIDAAADAVGHEDGVHPADPAAALRAILVAGLPTIPSGRVGVAVWTAYLAKSVGDPVLAELIGDTQRAAANHVESLLSDLGVPPSDAAGCAVELLALADGLGTRVLVEGMGAAEALAVLDRRLAQVTA